MVCISRISCVIITEHSTPESSQQTAIYKKYFVDQMRSFIQKVSGNPSKCQGTKFPSLKPSDAVDGIFMWNRGPSPYKDVVLPE